MPINRQKVMKAADKYLRQGKVEDAIGEFLKLVKDNPKDMNTINRVGDLYARIGNTGSAITHFSKIAEFYNQEGFLLKAIAIYKKITKLDPNYAAAYSQLAQLYAQQGLTMEARAQYQVVAEHHAKKGDSNAALSAYQEMLRLDPDDLKIQLTVAELLERMKRPRQALEAYVAVGESLDRRAMFAESRKVYEAALRLAPENNGVVRKLVINLRRQGKSGEAVQFLGGLLESRPGDLELLSLSGDAHLDSGDVAQAREIYEQVRKQAPDRFENGLNEARLVLQDDNLDACFEHLGTARRAAEAESKAVVVVPYVVELLDRQPDHLGALELLADLHESAQQTGLCRDACIRLAGASMQQGNLAGAAAALERLIRIDPDDSRHQERLHDVRERLKKEGKAPPRPAEKRAEPAPAAPAPPRPPAPPAQEAAAPRPPEPEVTAEPGVEVVGDIEAAMPAEPGTAEEVDRDFVAEHMTEAEVFVKYGLVDRAVEQLRQVTERYPRYAPAHESLLQIYRDEGQRESAAAEHRALAEIYRAQGDEERARQALAAADDLVPRAAAGPAVREEPAPAPPRPAAVAPAAAPQGAGTRAAAEGPAEEFVETAEEVEIEVSEAGLAPPVEALEEVDALIEGGALDEARKRLVKLRAEHPERSEIEERLSRIGMMEKAAEKAAAAGGATGSQGETDFFDLAAELDESLFEPQMAVEEAGGPDEAEGHSLEDLVAAFKKGVEQQVSSEDYETHYNLAIAYKEMGLIDEAIGEFQFASKSPDFFTQCCSMLGICFREKGMMALAIKWYEKGLENAASTSETEQLGLRYDLASLYADDGETARALELFTEVYGIDAGYRDVAERIQQLKEAGASG